LRAEKNIGVKGLRDTKDGYGGKETYALGIHETHRTTGSRANIMGGGKLRRGKPSVAFVHGRRGWGRPGGDVRPKTVWLNGGFPGNAEASSRRQEHAKTGGE